MVVINDRRWTGYVRKGFVLIWIQDKIGRTINDIYQYIATFLVALVSRLFGHCTIDEERDNLISRCSICT